MRFRYGISRHSTQPKNEPSPMIDEVPIKDEMIRLGQFLKLANFIDNGSDAKVVLADEVVSVNGEIETRRGRQLHPGDVVEMGGQAARVAHGDVPDSLPW